MDFLDRCRSFMETGFCRYHSKCQFAHGVEELRPVKRHPKYKTRLCKNFIEVCISFGCIVDEYETRYRMEHVPMGVVVVLFMALLVLLLLKD